MKNYDLKSIIISPPVGNWISSKNTTSVYGTFTLEERKGLLSQVLKTFRIHEGGFINKIGLRNPGIGSIRYNWSENSIYSIALLEKENENKWFLFPTFFNSPNRHMIEINEGCPNANIQSMTNNAIELYLNKFKTVIFKLPPLLNSTVSRVLHLYSLGARNFHLCNTIPTPKGGISGSLLKNKSIEIIKLIKKELSIDDYTIIGGGGIYDKSSINQYIDIGADHFSISTIFLKHPLKAFNLTFRTMV